MRAIACRLRPPTALALTYIPDPAHGPKSIKKQNPYNDQYNDYIKRIEFFLFSKYYYCIGHCTGFGFFYIFHRKIGIRGHGRDRSHPCRSALRHQSCSLTAGTQPHSKGRP